MVWEALELLRSRSDVALALAALLGEQRGVDVGQDAAGGDGDRAEQPAELFVVAHRQLDVARHDPVLLVVARRVAGELQDLQRNRIAVRWPRENKWGGGNAEERRCDLFTSAARYSRTAER